MCVCVCSSIYSTATINWAKTAQMNDLYYFECTWVQTLDEVACISQNADDFSEPINQIILTQQMINCRVDCI